MNLELSPEELERLADTLARKVAEKLEPLLKSHGQEKDTIFTVDTLSESLHISKNKIYNMTHLKQTPHFKVGRELRFRKKEIDAWLESNYTPSLTDFSNNNKRRVKTWEG